MTLHVAHHACGQPTNHNQSHMAAARRVQTWLYHTCTRRGQYIITAATSRRSYSKQLLENVPPADVAPMFDAVHRWVVFSDLHLSLKTADTCMDVLRTVHTHAVERNAGIVFLGDWWHIRAALPVEPLNAAIELLSKWTQPTLMLVGNHDQVSIGGLEHALTPLAAANPLVHVFDRPTLYKHALWLPYRRAHGDLTAAVNAAMQVTGGALVCSDGGDGGGGSGGGGGGGNGGVTGPLSAIFAHADIVGASMNSTYQAKEGLPPTLFPPGIPVWTGHYHTPHTVPGTSICYVGSPYQVSRSEAGQQKRLLVLEYHGNGGGRGAVGGAGVHDDQLIHASQSTHDSQSIHESELIHDNQLMHDGQPNGQQLLNHWRAVEQLPLDLGPRHYLLEGALLEGSTEHQQQMQRVVEEARRGDVVRWVVPEEPMGEEEEAAVDALRARGVGVQLVLTPTPKNTPRIQSAEALSPIALFTDYATRVNMHEDAQQLGLTMLTEVQGMAGEGEGGGGTVLQLQSVEMSGFGPFRENVSYELADGGLRVICGRNEDGPGSDSNGAGKTALVMAPLWALTGRGDARADAGASRGMTLSDVLHDDAKNCRVAVRGVANGHDFEVVRCLTRRGTRVSSSLTLTLDGQDATKAEIKLTQATIDALIGGGELMGRTVFLGQNDITFLLESHDKDFKTEMGRIVDLQLWEAAQEGASSKSRGCKGEMATLEQVVVNTQRVVDQFAAEAAQARQRSAAWQTEHTTRRTSLLTQHRMALQASESACRQVERQLPALQAWATAAEARVQEGGVMHEAGVQEGMVHEEEAEEVLHEARVQEEEEEEEGDGGTVHGSDDVAVALEHELQAVQARVAQYTADLHNIQQQVAHQAAVVGQRRGVVQALEQQLNEYQSLTTNTHTDADTHPSTHTRTHPDTDIHQQYSSTNTITSTATATTTNTITAATCDRCLQPIDETTYHTNLTRMQNELAAAQKQVNEQAATHTHLLSTLTTTTAALHDAHAAVRDITTRQQQHQTATAAAARAALVAVQEQEAARRAVLEEEMTVAKQQAAAAAREAQQTLHAVQRIHALATRHAHLTASLHTLQQDTNTPSSTSSIPTQPSIPIQPSSSTSIPTSPLSPTTPLSIVMGCCAAVEQALECVEDGIRDVKMAVRMMEAMGEEVDPHAGNVKHFEQLYHEEHTSLQQTQAQLDTTTTLQNHWATLDQAFGRAGIQSYLLEAVVGEMQKCSGEYLSVLAPDMHLVLEATSTTGGGGVAERIGKAVYARLPDGTLRPRHVRQLSGGERRRVALALALGYRQLAATRGRFAANVLVLDEVLQHLDEEGCSRVASLLKSLPVDTILVVGQAHSFVTQVFDVLDVVVKRGGASRIEVG